MSLSIIVNFCLGFVSVFSTFACFLLARSYRRDIQDWRVSHHEYNEQIELLVNNNRVLHGELGEVKDELREVQAQVRHYRAKWLRALWLSNQEQRPEKLGVNEPGVRQGNKRRIRIGDD